MKIAIEQEGDAQFEMAPMIDMVFLLLVFFMCASHMSVIQSVPMEIPTATKAVVPDERPNRFLVNITADGTVYSGDTEVTIDQLKELAKEDMQYKPNMKVYIRADQKTHHKDVRKVMNSLAETGLDNFIFGTFIPGDQ
ncbi:MAG: biopolymer transporter ExbD [Kiritimatiellae bacterium]|jgi:biopolymer transport protein ExbD|nr:biopolymer transporter ExbD [Kiritimatiellia bacterium]